MGFYMMLPVVLACDVDTICGNSIVVGSCNHCKADLFIAA
jgi:hypothetical protein